MYRTIFFCLCGYLIYIPTFAQDENREIAEQIVEIADEAYYNLRVLIVANEQYVQAAETDTTYVVANYMAGKTYLESNFKSRATRYLLRVYQIDPQYKFNILFLIGRAYQYGGEFEQAIRYYNQYLSQIMSNAEYAGTDFTPREEVERHIYECENGIEYKNNPKNYVIENVGPSINSEWDDFAPVLTEDENMMVFTTRRQDNNSNENVFDDMLYYEDIFIARKSSDSWDIAVNPGAPINGPYHDSNLAINADGTELYLYKSQNGGDIFVSYRQGSDAWTEPEPLNENINSTYSENSVSISPDGSTLFFSSDRPLTEEKTDLDIYYAQKDRRGRWGRAKNLGQVINTPFDEDGPFIDYDGKTLYFSSKGHKGMGGYDIYKSVYDSTTQEWSTPINLGYPMNTPDNDVYFVSTPDGMRGYYASAREDGYGFTDIYHIHLTPTEDSVVADAVTRIPEKEPENAQISPAPDPEPEPNPELAPVLMLLKTVDAQTGEVMNTNLSVSRMADNLPVNQKQLDEGLYEMRFSNAEATKYRFVVEKPGYMFKNVVVTVPAGARDVRQLRRYIGLDKIEEGYSVNLRNIYFEFNKAVLRPSSYDELRNLKRILDENPNYRVEIAGHTDNVGSRKINQRLSERRAKAVVDYLIKQGVNKGRMVAKGYGETRPLASNDDEREGRELNRRVEFTVLNLEK
jgi:outer membrane protein OmpA-like peptidoglycan-associated protein/tetratricopeptide (TPR) repeat protein